MRGTAVTGVAIDSHDLMLFGRQFLSRLGHISHISHIQRVALQTPGGEWKGSPGLLAAVLGKDGAY